MCSKNNLNSEILQGAKELVYILPSPSRLHKPLLGIKRIDNQWVCLFYLSAWDLLPDRYDPNKTKKQNKEAITKLRSKFYAIAKKSGVTMGRGAKVASLLRSIQSLGFVNLLGYERAEALLTALYYLQFAGGVK